MTRPTATLYKPTLDALKLAIISLLLRRVRAREVWGKGTQRKLVE